MKTADKMARGRRHGFTLLELLVVLVILALGVGLVAPGMARWIERSEDRAWRTDLAAYLESLPVLAYAEGRDLKLDANRLRQAVDGIPESVELKLPGPLIYTSRGAAQGAELLIRQPGQPELRWQITPVTGEVTVVASREPRP